jgi:hypothetical protein
LLKTSPARSTPRWPVIDSQTPLHIEAPISSINMINKFIPKPRLNLARTMETNKPIMQDPYDRYSLYKMRNKVVNENYPRQQAYSPNYTISDEIINQSTAVQKLTKSYTPKFESAYTVITNDVIRPIWNLSKQYAKGNPNIVNITDGVNFINFKKASINEIITIPLTLEDESFPKYNNKLKTEYAHKYFDNTLVHKLDELIQRSLTILITLKGNKQNIGSNEEAQQLWKDYYPYITFILSPPKEQR